MPRNETRFHTLPLLYIPWTFAAAYLFFSPFIVFTSPTPYPPLSLFSAYFFHCLTSLLSYTFPSPTVSVLLYLRHSLPSRLSRSQTPLGGDFVRPATFYSTVYLLQHPDSASAAVSSDEGALSLLTSLLTSAASNSSRSSRGSSAQEGPPLYSVPLYSVVLSAVFVLYTLLYALAILHAANFCYCIRVSCI